MTDFIDYIRHRLAGCRAWEAGIRLDENPHEWFSPPWRAWHDGWMQALHDAKAEANEPPD